MSFNNVVIWVDQGQAHLIHFNADYPEETSGKALEQTSPELSNDHIKTGNTGFGGKADQRRFFKDIIQAIRGSMDILLVGSSNEKNELMRYIIQHHRHIAEHIVGLITADHPSDGQLLSFAQRYFRKIDQMRLDQVNLSLHALPV